MTFFVPAHKVTCASLLAVNLQPAKINFGIPKHKEGEVAQANVERVRNREGDREAAEARRAEEVRWVQKRIKVDKARRTAATAATATKNDDKEEAARRTTADKRRHGAKRQRFCVKRQRQCFERMRGGGINATTNRQLRVYHSGSKGDSLRRQ